ncbi:flavin reductase family protein [Actinomadura sp. HBU206391]|uniref:flavin reductase family protein n=1 Tax=Actinomadura sp. HBU206391 TaxID=2731692 RepID=UPI001650869B|nr:flavin reductase family protein [Actinomadura sp. HBU206391]MBC6456915.1 flavin reductase [Actinomadura sp. HBU206391]
MTTASQPLHQAEPIESKTLRNVCGLFVTGVTVITAGEGARSAGTTVNSFTSVSLDPPLILFCLHKESRLRTVLQETRTFVVNFLAGKQAPLAWTFATRDTAALQDVTHHRSAEGAPILSDAMAFLACRVANEFEGGDHTIFVGEVVELGVPRQNQEPLIFFRGSLSALEEELAGLHPIWDG